MGEHEHTEVGARLVLDDEATEALEKIKEGFEGISEAVADKQHELAEFAKQALAVAAGFEVTKGLDSIKEFGEEVLNASRDSEEQVRALRDMLATSDKAGSSLEELGEHAKELREHLEGVAIATGDSTSSMISAYEEVSARTNKTAEETQKLIEDMAMAGKSIPGGINRISEAYIGLERGMIRPRNEIILLMQKTGVASGNVHQIAKGMQQLLEKNPAKAFELADQAIGRMAAKLKDSPLSFNETINSLKTLREQLFQTVGDPILKAMIGPMNELRSYLQKNKEKFGEYARELGEKVGEWVKEAAEKIQQGFEWVKTHADEIEDAIKSGAALLKQAVEFLLAHKEEIRDLMLAKMGANMLEKGAGIVGGAKAIGKGAAEVMSGGSELFGLEASSAGALASVGALAAGIAGLAATAWAAKTIYDDVSKFADDDSQARLEALQRAAKEGGVAHDTLEQWRDALITVHPEMVQMINHLVEMGDAARKAAEDQAKDAHGVGDQLKNAAGNKAAVQLFHDAFKRMHDAHNEAQMKYLAGILGANSALVDAMHKAGVDLTDIGEDLKKAYVAMRPGDATAGEEIQAILDEQRKAAAKSALTSATFDFRGSSFQIKQDFKDQDPDRILLLFQRDLGRTALAQTQAKGARGHGL